MITYFSRIPKGNIAKVPGEIKRSRDLREGRWSWTFKFAQKRSWVGRWSWDEQIGRLLLRPSCLSTAVQRTLSLWLCPSTAVETATARCTSRWAMARGHRLNTSIVLAAVHGLSGLFRAVSAVEPSLCRPLPTLSPSLISHLASVDVKQQERKREHRITEFCSVSVFLSLSVSQVRSRNSDISETPMKHE